LGLRFLGTEKYPEVGLFLEKSPNEKIIHHCNRGTAQISVLQKHVTEAFEDTGKT
jgi:hypothetical protein